ncbi:MAG: hypothetical protein LBU36_03520 [Clostridiales bacterium]|jgi:uncharacterized membrane protein YcgQ (UPF0703/DUF1980 family)|nr:hypothetical protein [Clostridiales bacterium]
MQKSRIGRLMKIPAAALLIMTAAASLTGCGATAQGAPNEARAAREGAAGDVIFVKDKMFITQINDMYANYEDYLGKTISYEGVFDIYTADEAKGLTYYYVIRYGPGCCGNDGNVGFEVAWDDDSKKDYPKQDDWVKVTGVLEQYEEDGEPFLRLRASELTVMDERGLESVIQ